MNKMKYDAQYSGKVKLSGNFKKKKQLKNLSKIFSNFNKRYFVFDL